MAQVCYRDKKTKAILIVSLSICTTSLDLCINVRPMNKECFVAMCYTLCYNMDVFKIILERLGQTQNEDLLLPIA